MLLVRARRDAAATESLQAGPWAFDRALDEQVVVKDVCPIAYAAFVVARLGKFRVFGTSE